MGAVMDNTEKNYDSCLEQIKQIRKVYFWRTAFFGLVILAAGIVIGGASMSILSARNLAKAPARIEYDNLMLRLNQILGLTQAQTNKIRPIINQNMQHLEDIRENARADIIKTLEQMNKEVTPILGESQKTVWSRELVRLQGELNPAPPRGGGGGGGGRGMRRGAEQAGPGGRRMGGRGQRMGGGAGRGFQSPPPPGRPNSFYNDMNENVTIRDNTEPNIAVQ
jgi:hypothetical protein